LKILVTGVNFAHLLQHLVESLHKQLSVVELQQQGQELLLFLQGLKYVHQ
jgi:hypothetical protein